MASTSTKMNAKKITISLPQDLARRFKERVPVRQRSDFIAKILEEHLALEEQLNVLDETAGCWRDENHPEMATTADIDNWLVNLRTSWQR